MNGQHASKPGRQIAYEDSRQELQVEPEKLDTHSKDLKPHLAGEDSHQRTEVKMPKKINEDLKKKFLKKGMSEEDATKYAEEDEDEGDDTVSKAEKLLAEVQDSIRKGENLFTEDDIKVINAKHQDQLERVIEQQNTAYAKLRDRTANMEKGMGALVDLVADMSKTIKTQAEEMQKSLTALGDVAELKKSMTTVPPVAEDAKKDELNKGALTPGKGDNAPVETPKALTEIPSPHDEPAKKDEPAAMASSFDFMSKAMELQKTATDEGIKRRLTVAISDASLGTPLNQLKSAYGDLVK